MKRERTFLLALMLTLSGFISSGQTVQTLCSFNGANGNSPQAALTLGNDGNFYGTTSSGGSGNDGLVFRVTTNGMLTTLAAFTAANPWRWMAGLTLGPDGNFYGTTFKGGSSGDGSVFRVTTNGSFMTLVSFNGANGAEPIAGLTLGPDGNLYGTTSEGTVYRMTTNGALTTLATFTAAIGEEPMGLTLGTDGNFYGTTFSGGINTLYGSVFRATTNGTLATLAAFSDNGTAGYNPNAELTLGSDGNFYGTTQNGGSRGGGSVFRVTTNGMITTLVSFTAYNNGEYPYGGLMLGTDGNFYGTTSYGGSPGGGGTIFRVTTNGTLTTLVAFPSNGTNGSTPLAGLTLGTDGNFYGTTSQGGNNGDGTVFRLLLPPAINIQPESQTNISGTTVTLMVSATSLLPMSFQWQKNGFNLTDCGKLSGSASNSLTITDVSDNDVANYSAIISNADGSVTSSIISLVVIDLPTIATQPQPVTIISGHAANFTVVAVGSQPLAYQWQFNGTNLPDLTNTILTIQNAFPANSGAYTVAITNFYGGVTSNPAFLMVLPLDITTPTKLTGGQFRFSFDTAIGVDYTVQCSTNLMEWYPFLTLGGIGLPLTLIDPNTSGSQQRFYRIELSPQ